jgi:hypothetical protein
MSSLRAVGAVGVVEGDARLLVHVAGRSGRRAKGSRVVEILRTFRGLRARPPRARRVLGRASMPTFRLRAFVPVALVLVSSLAGCDFGGPYLGNTPYGGDAWGSSGSGFGGATSGQATDFAIATCEADALYAFSSSSSSSKLLFTGDRCETASDCAPVCCGCGGPEWLAASCVDNQCAAPEIACSRTGTCEEGVWIDEPSAPGWPDACGDLTYGDDVCDACMTTSCCQAMAACATDAACMGPEACIARCEDDDCVAACEEASAESPFAQALDSCRATSCADVCY